MIVSRLRVDYNLESGNGRRKAAQHKKINAMLDQIEELEAEIKRLKAPTATEKKVEKNPVTKTEIEMIDRLRNRFNCHLVELRELDMVNLAVYVNGVQIKQMWVSKRKGMYRLHDNSYTNQNDQSK